MSDTEFDETALLEESGDEVTKSDTEVEENEENDDDPVIT